MTKAIFLLCLSYHLDIINFSSLSQGNDQSSSYHPLGFCYINHHNQSDFLHFCILSLLTKSANIFWAVGTCHALNLKYRIYGEQNRQGLCFSGSVSLVGKADVNQRITQTCNYTLRWMLWACRGTWCHGIIEYSRCVNISSPKRQVPKPSFRKRREREQKLGELSISNVDLTPTEEEKKGRRLVW